MTERQVESVIIEIPKGSRNKFEYDNEKRLIKFDRMLSSSMVYPSRLWFFFLFLDTLALDGDPLDAMVLTWEPTFPCCVIDVYLVALFDMQDHKGRDQKILCVPKNDPMWNYIESVDQVPPHLFREITHFFQTYKNLKKEQVKVMGWKSLETVFNVLQEAKDRYIEQKK